jgi:hypothetical protein
MATILNFIARELLWGKKKVLIHHHKTSDMARFLLHGKILHLIVK